MSGVLNVLCAKDIMYPMYFGTQQNIKGINMSGLYKILSHIITFTGYGEDCVVVFDSKTDRTDYMSSYKEGRNHIPEIALQCEILEKICPRLGVQVLKKDNFECDDLVYCLTKNNYNDYRRISIFSCDRDIVHNIDDQGKINMISVNTTQPSLNKINYEYCIIKGKVIQYNTVLPYKFFFGDKSDKIPPLNFHDDSGLTLDHLYHHFIKFSKDNGYTDRQLSDSEAMAEWIEFMTQCFDDDMLADMYNRMEVIYPRYNDKVVAISTNLNKDYLAKVLTSFEWYDLLNLAGLKANHELDNLVDNLLSSFPELVYEIGVENSQVETGQLADKGYEETAVKKSNSFGWGDEDDEDLDTGEYSDKEPF